MADKPLVHFTYATAEYWLVYPDALVNLALPNKKKAVPHDAF